MLCIQMAALATAATAFIASGCGSSKTGSTGSTSHTSTLVIPTVRLASGRPLAHAQLITQGDAICASANAKIKAISANSTAAIINTLPQAATYYTTEANDLGKLVPSASMSRDWSQIVNDIESTGKYTDIAAQYAKEKQWQPATLLYKEGLKLKARSLAIAKRAGFRVCSRAR